MSGWRAYLASAEVIVVAIFGTGVKGGVVKEPYASAISMVNASRAVKVAVDLPSGIDPATGAASDPTVRADYTVALHLPKVGLRGREEFTGEVVVVPIGIRGTRGLKVFQIPVGPMQNFVYLVEDEESREAMAIDSGWETQPIVKVAASGGDEGEVRLRDPRAL